MDLFNLIFYSIVLYVMLLFIKIFKLSGMDKMCMIERALIDYLIEKKGNSDVSVEVFFCG